MPLNEVQSQQLKLKLKEGITVGKAQGISHALLRELSGISTEFRKEFKDLQAENRELIMNLASALSESNANVPTLATRQKSIYGKKALVQEVRSTDTLRLDEITIDGLL